MLGFQNSKNSKSRTPSPNLTSLTSQLDLKRAVKLWALDLVSFKLILMKTAILKRNQYKTFLREVPILAEMTEHEILTIADALHEETFEDGTTICEEGRSGDRFYIMKEGSVVRTKNLTDGTLQEVAQLNKGSYFWRGKFLYFERSQSILMALISKLEIFC